MDTESKARLIEVFNAALALKAEDRAVFLAEACDGNEALRREVESLLEHAQPENSFIAKPAVERYAKDLVGAAPLDLIGQQLGHYLITEAIGSGGMGQVYKARDQKLGRYVAIKILPPEFTADASLVRRFEQEARAASALNHPNIITIHEIGQHETLHFIVMEYVAGQTLRTRLQAGKLPRGEAIEIAAQMADALSAAHHVGIIHRDIKPENVMLRADGRVKVLDFGIAKLGEGLEKGRRGEVEKRGDGSETTGYVNSPTLAFSLSPTRPFSTVLGSVLGTVKYMSPEQAGGEALNEQADVFSLGQILLEMVTGKSLFAGKKPNEVLHWLCSEVEVLSADYQFDGVPRALERIIRKSLQRNLAERYESARQLLNDLKTLQRRTATKVLRRSVVVCVLGILLLLGALGLAVQLSTIETWEEKVLRDGHTKRVNSLAFAPNGQKLISVSDDKAVIVWDFAERKRLKTLNDHTARVNTVAFSADGNWFATGSHDKKIIVWDATTFQQIASCEHPNAVRALAFSPDGKWLAAVTSDEKEDGSGRRTFLWNTSHWQREKEISYGAEYGPILFSPDSRLLITNQVQWDLVSGKPLVNDDLPREKKWGGWNWAAFSPDAKMLVSAGSDGSVAFRHLLRAGDLAESQLVQTTRPHEDFGRAAAFSPDGKQAATGTDEIVLWDATTKKIESRFNGNSSVWNLAFSPDGQALVSAHGNGSIQVWDLVNRRRTTGLDGHGNHVMAVAYSSDGKHIASAGKDGAVIVWNAQTEQKEATFFSHKTRVVNLAFAPDNTWLVTFDQDGYLIRWDLEHSDARWKVKAHSGSSCLVISPDGKWITNPYALFDSTNGRELLRWDQIQAGLMMTDYAAFSPDSRRVAVTSAAKIALLDTQHWQVMAQHSSDSILTCISFSPDGQSVLTGSEEGTLAWWDAQTLHKNAEIKAHKAAVSATIFSPDGKTIATADKDEIALWEANRPQRIYTIGARSVPIYSLAFAPDGKRLVAGARDAAVRMYLYQRSRWGKPVA